MCRAVLYDCMVTLWHPSLQGNVLSRGLISLPLHKEEIHVSWFYSIKYMAYLLTKSVGGGFKLILKLALILIQFCLQNEA